ncbi:MAPKKK cascade protein kinase regulator Ste50 [Sporothrix brasiliensis 5110]|uniref:MAPKKK cascade protein kinase regulator Ste50 n=1 Tax=Sporothrix brasiliensis 5110 TaxID=1398154 RepID=A0A0C2IZL6_9PEZI|nr:MAPKKK cascade protein kinase regulator Ste50 [Sporothrix brasiliensis 5110]KIH92160.1 MAPKKK cascade protein kinase regulator Ste50 [Sporothrix brasiliensis 5110]
MSFQQGTAYAESDADDEYERDIHDSSPIDATESELSPTETDIPSAEHTPTTYGYHSSADRLPETIITDWSAEECADFIATIGLQQYADGFIENEIVGEALVALLHDDLKQMGINSVGHRLTILKSVYEVKKAQEVPIESDHYVPLTAETEAQATMATLKDIKHLVEQLRLRDERMSLFEQDYRRLTDDFRRLREDVLPALRLVKDAQQPLPHVNSNGSTTTTANNDQSYPFEAIISPPVPTPQSGTQSINIKRQYSTRKMVPTGTTPKTTSPTHLQISHDRMIAEQTLDPANAAERAVLSSQHLAAANGNGQTASSPSYPSPNIPSPTSPPISMNGTTLASRSYRSDQPTPSGRSTFAESDHAYNSSSRDKHTGAPRRMQTPAPDTPGSNASVEIFKSFRVSMDDPCYKVLPAALRRYQINAPPDQYALYIVYGDQERCLALNEKPLILFKQLDKEGKKPMFMLRKTANAPADGPTDVPGSAGLNAAARGTSTAYDPPGGII